MRILFFTQSGPQGASSRYRVYQYLPFFEAQGWKVRVAPALPAVLHRTYFFSRSFFWKAILSVVVLLRRLAQIRHVPFADVVFIQKPLLPGNWLPLEALVKKLARKVIFDFDDAIFLPSPFGTHGLSEQTLRSRFQKIVVRADLVIAGNAFLAREAAKFAPRVEVLPTVVDARRFKPREDSKPRDVLVLGWMGSPSTAHYLREIEPVIAEISGQFQVRWVFVGASPLNMNHAQISFEPWSYETEVQQLQSFDIFISPLRDTPWEQGKCGLKTLTAMSAGLPVIASAVGVHKEIIQDGVNGFLASSSEEWEKKLSQCLSDQALRQRLGKEARKTVLQNFDLYKNGAHLLSILKSL